MEDSRVLVIADAAGSGHHYHAGDEAMAEVALERLKAIVGPDNIILACPHPWSAGAVYGVKAIYMPLRTLKTWLLHLLFNPLVTGFRLARCFWHLRRTNFVFKTGGGNIRGKHTKFPILTLARIMRKKIVVVSQTLGPLQGSHRSVLRNQLEEALWIGVRDRAYSGDQLGLPVHFTVDDAVFLQPRHNTLTSRLVRDYPSMIGISLTDCKGVDAKTVNALHQAMKVLATQLDAVTVFIPHHAPWGGGDLSSARAAMAKWGDSRAILLDRVPAASAMIALIGHLRLVISCRYHGVVLGLAMGVPTIALYHDDYTKVKMEGAFDQFGLEPMALPVVESPDRLTEMAQAALADHERFAAAAYETQTNRKFSNITPYELLKVLINQPR